MWPKNPDWTISPPQSRQKTVSISMRRVLKFIIWFLSSFLEPVGVESVELAQRPDFFGSGFIIVFEADKVYLIFLDVNVAGAVVAVPRLADRADIDDCLFVFDNRIDVA